MPPAAAAVVGRCCPPGAVVGELLPRLQDGAVDEGQGQPHVGGARLRVLRIGGVAGHELEILGEVVLGHRGLGLQKRGLDGPAVLLGQQLPHALQGGGHIHPDARLLLGEGKGPGLGVIPGDSASFASVWQDLAASSSFFFPCSDRSTT